MNRRISRPILASAGLGLALTLGAGPGAASAAPAEWKLQIRLLRANGEVSILQRRERFATKDRCEHELAQNLVALSMTPLPILSVVCVPPGWEV